MEKKWLPSIAISPKTGPTEIFTFLNQIYQVLIMSVEPGFAGQPFLKEMLDKVDPLIGYRDTANLHFKIAMDGGITMSNLPTIIGKGVDQVAVGSEIFEHKAGAAKAYQLLSEKVE